ncbi:hypothetical protein M406DRAFT_346115 [Cryphonectria parasitica EP155]|uniref:NADP-dependent oxidoreductase domain-containing protein n=1 Tax=Cryphonectria parasitica (strain ATCC 38755 / EP155) TaxID=660469 RepID=A0A9P4Y3R7_CRYP1|nr:uncharacterized protein M406DRAFT_346115 [Cryphonectria parasitica EP155]KAF3765974.1 hypothetical protein M406DRAFT_346115 [Cryphonectria parasitica EP155]
MNSSEATHQPDATGTDPKQLSYLPNLKLNDGHDIPMLAYGLGTANYKRGAGRDVIDDKIITDTVTAIKCGYTHLDGAEGYGNEPELGRAIKKAGVPRERLFVTTKCSNVEAGQLSQSLDTSLAKLGLDHVDLYLIHQPFFADGDLKLLQSTWAEMEAIQASGRATSIGVSNYTTRHLDVLLETAKVVPAINQIELHPYLQHGDLLAYHREKGIAVSAYAPLTAVTKARPGPLDDVYPALAKKYGVGEGDIALRWVIDQGAVVITTSSKEERLQSFLTKLPSFKLTPKEVELISEKGREKNFRGFWTHKIKEGDWA